MRPMVSGTGAEALEADLDIWVFVQVEEQGHACAAELADDRCHSCAGGTTEGLTAVAKDEDGVQNDVHHGTHQLADHAQVGAAGSGQQLFAHGLGEKAQTEDAAHRKILDALLRNSRITGLCIEIGLHAGKANDEEHHEAAQRKKDAVFRRGIGAALVLFAQTFGQHGVHAYAGAHAHSDHHILQREGEGHSGEGAFTHMGHEHRVHHVVKRLHQHGDHHGHAQLDQQRVDLHGAHNVFPRLGGRGLGLLCFHVCSFFTLGWVC